MNSNAAEANANLGILELQNGSIKDAEVYFAKSSASNNADEALGNLYIAQGKYDLAAQKLSKSVTNSAALAQILSNNYSAAKNTLGNIKNADATTYYLKAVLAARMENSSEIAPNLTKSIELDPSFAKKIAGDVEFTKYADIIKSIAK